MRPRPMNRRYLTAIALAATAVALEARPKLEPVQAVDTEHTIFSSGGVVELKDSAGDLRVEGWDRTEVELIVTKSAIEHVPGDIDRIIVELERPAADRLVIITKQPLPRGADVQLSYTIRIPRRTGLVIGHQRGNVRVRDVTGDMRVTNRSGRIELSLPRNESYAIDAKAKSGRVASDQALQQSASTPLAPLRLTLRVGTGNITLRAT